MKKNYKSTNTILNLKQFNKEKYGFNFFPLGLGTFDQGNNRSKTLLHNALKTAYLYGINFIDTAPNYYSGQAEKVIGDFFVNKNNKNIIISTKVGLYRNYYERKKYKSNKLSNSFFNYSSKYIERSIIQSLKNLRLKKLDIVLIHNPENLYIYNKVMPFEILKKISYTMEKLAKKNYLKYWGISSYSGVFEIDSTPPIIQIYNLMEYLKKNFKRHHFKVLQAPYNIINFNKFLEKSHIQGARRYDLFKAIKKNNLLFLTNTSVHKSFVNKNLNLFIDLKAKNLYQRSIEFVRKYSFADINLVGMTKPINIVNNIKFYKNLYKNNV